MNMKTVTALMESYVCLYVCRHEVQQRTNQIAKDTGTYVKDLNRLSASQHSVEPVSCCLCV